MQKEAERSDLLIDDKLTEPETILSQNKLYGISSVPVEKVVRSKRITKEDMEQLEKDISISDLSEPGFYIRNLLNNSVMEERKSRNKEFFDKDDFDKKVNIELENLPKPTEQEIIDEVYEQRDNGSKKNRKKILKKDRDQAFINIMIKRKVKIQKRLDLERYELFSKKYSV